MKLADLITLPTTSVVNNGENIPNMYTTKNPQKKKKHIKLKKSVYGVGVGIGMNVPRGTNCEAGVVGAPPAGGNVGGDAGAGVGAGAGGPA